MHAILGRREIVRAVIKSGDVDHLVHDRERLAGLPAVGKREVGCFPGIGVMQLLPEGFALVQQRIAQRGVEGALHPPIVLRHVVVTHGFQHFLDLRGGVQRGLEDHQPVGAGVVGGRVAVAVGEQRHMRLGLPAGVGPQPLPVEAGGLAMRERVRQAGVRSGRGKDPAVLIEVEAQCGGVLVIRPFGVAVPERIGILPGRQRVAEAGAEGEERGRAEEEGELGALAADAEAFEPTAVVPTSLAFAPEPTAVALTPLALVFEPSAVALAAVAEAALVPP